MANETITIDNVNVERLDRQRLALQRVLAEAENRCPEYFTSDDVEMCEGIQNMLDAWSDERYYEST